jgi:hypothetical protein
MTVLNQLATALNRRDEVPNQELAQRILKAQDSKAVKELVENLRHKDKNIQSDCIKVLYEIGERRPDMIAEYSREFEKLLLSKHNRLVWGAMTALDYIATVDPEAVRGMLPNILAVADRGSVITRDHTVGILAKLASVEEYADECVPLLMEQLTKSPDNQFPMYVEKAFPAITEKHKKRFQSVVKKRLEVLEQESKRKRVLKVLKKLGDV